MNVSTCAHYSGPNCTWGFPYWIKQCLQQIPGSVRGDFEWAECVLSSSSQLEQSVYSQRQYILTLWPAFIGVICSFGPDPSDMVFDNVWWALIFAMTCSGLPGFDSRKPRHHAKTDLVDDGRQICESHSENFDPSRSPAIPRSFGRPNQKRVEAVVRMEWMSYSISWLCYIVFNILFVMALTQSTVYTVPHNYAAGFWYWLSAAPALVSVCAEAIQNRVELYEPLQETSGPPTRVGTDDSLVRATGSSEIEGMQIPLQTFRSSKSAAAMTTVTRTASNAPPEDALYRRSQHRTFFRVWWRIAFLQYRRKRYRLLVKPEDDRWFFLLWKLVVNLGRICIFAIGSTTMGGIILMPEPEDLVLLIILIFLTSVPRMMFFSVWRNKARGADLVVICDQLAIGQEFSAAMRQNSFKPSTGRIAN